MVTPSKRGSKSSPPYPGISETLSNLEPIHLAPRMFFFSLLLRLMSWKAFYAATALKRKQNVKRMCVWTIVRLFSLRSCVLCEQVFLWKTKSLSRGVGGFRTGGGECLDVSGLCQWTLKMLFWGQRSVTVISQWRGGLDPATTKQHSNQAPSFTSTSRQL